MKVEVKKVNSTRRELLVEVPKDRVQVTFDEVYKDIGKKAKIKGFRPGKVPRHILEQQHSHTAQDEVIKKIVPEAYNEALKKEKINPLDMPEIHDVNYKEGVVSFTAKLDVKPEIDIKDYKKIKVKRKSSEVTEEDISKTMDYFKKGQGQDDKAPIDDAFANGLGYPNLEDFKKSISRQLEMDKDRENRMDVENQIVEFLLKKTKVDVPESLHRRQLESRIADTQKRMRSQGVPDDDIAKQEEDMRKELNTVVEKDIKVYLVLDKIAELEKIEVAEGENLPAKVIEFLLKEAKWEK